MSLSKCAPSTAALARAARPSSRSIRVASSSQKRWLSTEKEPAEKGPTGPSHGKSFQGQLWESTAARMQRQKAERAKFTHESTSPTGRNSALAFGIEIIMI